ncbi:peptidase M13 [Corynebacterium sp. CCM 9185]|uniref:Peptidase M13 n=1 Tax=Corynebacterium marambiense TaxID=2765364 RepID=A0ABS0VTM9_9CORY|nr:M13-type metalloendopeptidase [Corynebacterium marambiense]MBI8999706.1 peptidase M13 [Corynebacterium marambiense]MCK7662546.1 peptidase M13 [Corynebacterium marambiense]MCX7541834.1 peptidase M13 [Corynebacterium marambiense]
MKDLYRYVNGPWLDSHVIPDDRGADGNFHKLRDRSEEDVHTIVEADDGRAGILYNCFMDIEAIEAAGVAVLGADLDQLDVDTPEELAAALGHLDREGVGAPAGFWVEKDSAGEEALAYLVQSGLGLPDEAYYRDPAHAETLAAYRAHVATMLDFLPADRLGGLSADAAAERIVELEKRIAAGHWDVVAARDAVKTFNPTEFADLPALVRTLCTASGLPEHRLIVMMPSYLGHLDELLREADLADWKLWATWHILNARAGLLTDEISRTNFNFYGTVLQGATEQRDRWKRGIGLAERFVGEEIGRLFVAEHFPPEHKKQMLTLVDHLIGAYRERITNLVWMTEQTRRKALVKLDKFNAKIGYPDNWRSYEGLVFEPGGANLVANVRRGNAFLHDYELNKIGKPADRAEWVTTPQTVNAFYNPVVNDITFPAAILRPPFFDPDADAATNFGAIGAVIGHEIGHGFDDQGSQYDGDGNLNSWWTDEDRTAFEELTARLVGQFNGRVPSVLEGTESTGVNGEFTLGENIGDLGGLGIAVVAYGRYLADQGLDFDSAPTETVDHEGGDPNMEGREFTGLQRLFISWARVWRTAIRPELATQYLAVDPHSPAEFRCNIIAANVDEFYRAFDVHPEGMMYLEPTRRVTIW